MAIKFTNGTYYKINMEESYIAPHGVMVALDVYGNEESRLYEKNRQAEINILLEKIEEELGKRFAALDTAAKDTGLQYEELIDAAGNVKSEYPQLAALVKHFQDLASDMHTVNMNYCVCVEPEQTFNCNTLKELDTLKMFGLKEEWLTTPIIKCGKEIMNVCDIQDKMPSFDYAEFYRLLKQRFINCVDV